MQKLLRRFAYATPLEADDFLRDYIDSRFGRFFLYLLAYGNNAQDWDKAGHRLGFDGQELLADYRPQWHHIFPKKFLEGKINDDKIDALANIAVIGPSINIRISAKSPMNYIERYEITTQKLAQQLVTDNIETLSLTNFEKWLNQRAQRLADAGNEFLNELKGGL